MLGGQTAQAAARAEGVCPRTAKKWLTRFQAEGPAGLQDRSSRPRRLRQPTSGKAIAQIIALRRKRWTGKHIAAQVGVSAATVSRVAKTLDATVAAFHRRPLEHISFRRGHILQQRSSFGTRRG